MRGLTNYCTLMKTPYSIETPVHKSIIQKSLSYCNGLQHFYRIKNNALSESSNRPMSTNFLDNSEITYRQRNLWQEKGLFELEREAGWRKFSFMDAIWLLIIKDLRELGVPSSSILKVKEYVMSESKQYGVKYPFLEFANTLSLDKGFWLYLFVFRGGVSIILDEAEVAQNEVLLRVEPHVRICFNSIHMRYLGEFNIDIDESIKMVVTREEKKLISFIRQEPFDQIEVKSKEGRMYSFESIKWVNPAEAINYDIDHGDITLQKQNGKITKARIAKKKRFDNLK